MLTSKLVGSWIQKEEELVWYGHQKFSAVPEQQFIFSLMSTPAYLRIAN